MQPATSIAAGQGADAWRGMSRGARERALQAEMRADRNLHPALYPPSDNAQMLGHYRVRLQPCDLEIFPLMRLGQA